MSPTKCSSLLAIALTVAGLCSCNRQSQQPQYANYATGDPAAGNLAPADQYTAQAPQAPAAYRTPAAPPVYEPQEAAYYQPIAEAPEPPPPLPEYDQPACPGENYEWTPGYWDYSNAGYYWVPGAWVMAPWVGALWTPPWWGYNDNAYVLHPGYWAPHIGFYGGVDYGYGYTGHGYYGAYWDHGAMRYNRVVTNVSTTVVTNVYNYRVPDHRREGISYNGGRGGIDVRPSAPELAVARDPRTPAVVEQVQHARQAASNRAQFASRDHVRPAALAAPAPLATAYRAPSPHPPAAALRQVPRPADTGRPAPIAHNEPRPSASPNVPAGEPGARFDRSGNVTRPQQPVPPVSRPVAPPAASALNRPNAPTPMPRQEGPNRPTPENRGFGAPRPGPVQANVHQAQPAPQARPGMPPQQTQPRPEPQRAMAPRPEPQHGMAPTPVQPRPEPQRAMAPRPEPQHAVAPPPVQPRPEPQRAVAPRSEPQRAMAPPPVQPRPEPQRAVAPRPEPQRAMTPPAAQPRPEPQRAVAPRPEPQHAMAPPSQPRPEPPHATEQRSVPQVRPEPQHAQPPAARPVPPPRTEERKK